MTVIKIKFGEVKNFVIENGYCLALYKKEIDGNWHLSDKEIDHGSVHPDTIVFAGNIKGNINMNETVTIDKKLLFKLHNNYNIPEIIPCIIR